MGRGILISRFYVVAPVRTNVMSTSTQISVQKDNTETVEWADSGKHQLDQQEAQRLGVEFDPNSPENKKLVRKLDWRLVVSIQRSLMRSSRAETDF